MEDGITDAHKKHLCVRPPNPKPVGGIENVRPDFVVCGINVDRNDHSVAFRLKFCLQDAVVDLSASLADFLVR